MSKECIRNCPRINEAVEYMNPDLVPELATNEILATCEASYDCQGPKESAVEVTTGIFRKRTALELINICGLQEVSQQ